jgi:hypothetical protein
MTAEDRAQLRDRDRRRAPGGAAVQEQLSRSECLGLLASVQIGRFVYTRQALPAIEPVGFAISNNNIVILADTSGQIATAARGDVVAFAADALDSTAMSRWSVTVIGRCRPVCEPEEIRRLRRLPLIAGTQRSYDNFICIGIEIVHGRRLQPGGNAALTRAALTSTPARSASPSASGAV